MLSIYETDKRRFSEDMLPHYLDCAAWADLPEDTEALTKSAHSFGERYIFEHNGKLIIE